MWWEFNYRSVWKWSSSDGRWEERTAARRRKGPHWGRCLRLKLWCWSWSWGVSARTPAPPAAPALVGCRSRRSGKSGEFPSRWLGVNLGGRTGDMRQLSNRAKIKPSELDQKPKWDGVMRKTQRKAVFSSHVTAAKFCGTEKMRSWRKETIEKKRLCLQRGCKCGDKTRHTFSTNTRHRLNEKTHKDLCYLHTAKAATPTFQCNLICTSSV